jgi:hypothetical protein
VLIQEAFQVHQKSYVTPVNTIERTVTMVGYYDYVLGLVPVTLVGLTAALVARGVAFTVAAPIGAGAAALIVGHALFVNGPVSPSPSGQATDDRLSVDAD